MQKILWYIIDIKMKKIKAKTPKYENPPLAEVVFGLQFSDLTTFSAPYIGDLWTALGRKNFTSTSEQYPILKLDKTGMINSLLLPQDLKRYWFIHKDEESLVQFQRDRFIYNWRKKPKSEYPHYDKTKSSFFKYYKILSDTCKKLNLEKINPEVMELSYINIIPFDDASEIGEIFRGLTWPKDNERLKSAPSRISYTSAFEIPKISSMLYVSIATAINTENNSEVLKFEISCKGQMTKNTTKDMESWLNTAHEWIVWSFTDLTTSKAHKKWGRYV